jgi:hypothetical protein
LGETLQAIRPCRESKTGWTRKLLEKESGEPKLLKLNEHGPALNVFWSRLGRMGAGVEWRHSTPGKLLKKKKLPDER